MTYYRPRVPAWLWVTLAIMALASALFFAGRATVDMIKESGRQAAYTEAHKWARATVVAQRERFAKERDSLRAVVRGRDTVLVPRIKRVRDTTWLPADTTPVVRYAACRAQLDTLASDCAAFRESATAALRNADSLHASDSIRALLLVSRGSAASDSVRRLTTRIDRAPSWGTVAKGSLAGAGVGALLCLIYCGR